MKILVWHGYLLSGSGSNIYTRNTAAEWRREGHDVLCMCQERDVAAFDMIDAHGDFSDDNRTFEVSSTGAPPTSGRCTVLRPAIGHILPVYVYDEYEGFSAKRFVDLSDDELDAYIERNIEAMVVAIERFEPDAIITGHEVMGPYIAKRACEKTGTRFITKLHGSALEYAVKEDPERFLRYAIEGLSAASVVAGGSRYMIDEASAFIPGWRAKARVVNPGADVEIFRPMERDPPARPTVGFVGKLIANKGVHNLLAAAPLVGDLDLVVVGYGDLEVELRDLARLVVNGDAARVTRFAVDRDDARFAALRDFMTSAAADASYWQRARGLDISFTGRLEHDPLSKVLPTVDVLAVPSILAEAFGMVAVEGAACGVLPVVPAHSGIGEVGAEIERRLGLEGSLTYDPRDPIEGLAAALGRVLAIPFDERRALGLRLAGIAHERWSWKRCADELLAAALH